MDDLRASIVQSGLETACNRFYSKYRGIVSDTKDPLGLGRVQVIVPMVARGAPLPRWALPCFPGAGKNSGMFWPPDEGDPVLVWFENGDTRYPNYECGWFADQPKDGIDIDPSFAPAPGAKPYRRGFSTKKGHKIVFDDTDGAESIQIIWSNSGKGDQGTKAVIGIDPNGSISLVASSGQRLVLDDENKQLMYMLLDADGNAICTISADSVNGVLMTTSSGGSVETSVGQDFKGNVNVMAMKAVNVAAPAIGLGGSTSAGGSKAVFSMVLGEVLKMLLQQLITQIAAITVNTGTGPSTPPNNAAAITAIGQTLKTILSATQTVAP